MTNSAIAFALRREIDPAPEVAAARGPDVLPPFYVRSQVLSKSPAREIQPALPEKGKSPGAKRKEKKTSPRLRETRRQHGGRIEPSELFEQFPYIPPRHRVKY